MPTYSYSSNSNFMSLQKMTSNCDQALLAAQQFLPLCVRRTCLSGSWVGRKEAEHAHPLFVVAEKVKPESVHREEII